MTDDRRTAIELELRIRDPAGDALFELRRKRARIEEAVAARRPLDAMQLAPERLECARRRRRSRELRGEPLERRDHRSGGRAEMLAQCGERVTQIRCGSAVGPGGCARHLQKA